MLRSTRLADAGYGSLEDYAVLERESLSVTLLHTKLKRPVPKALHSARKKNTGGGKLLFVNEEW
ncbi:hypothetical protein ELS83_18335 [Marinifilum sp. JC070]|uniref:Transposase IS4-like domain-containing protein n=1 Tax=Marinifilum caeruleilacunae TaxID=2499076 RepID=A0ABX1X0Z5_9BACT|nr:hypothetical protein [Marinifilum caeruleilacunae]